MIPASQFAGTVRQHICPPYAPRVYLSLVHTRALAAPHHLGPKPQYGELSQTFACLASNKRSLHSWFASYWNLGWASWCSSRLVATMGAALGWHDGLGSQEPPPSKTGTLVSNNASRQTTITGKQQDWPQRARRHGTPRLNKPTTPCSASTGVQEKLAPQHGVQVSPAPWQDVRVRSAISSRSRLPF